MIEKQEVEDIKIMFPKYSETIFKLSNQIKSKLTAVEHDVECDDENSEPPEWHEQAPELAFRFFHFDVSYFHADEP